MESWDPATLSAVKKIPLLTVSATPRDGARWTARLREEYQALITYVRKNKENDTDWFSVESNADGTEWRGKCWYVHELIRYEFDLRFTLPVTYPTTPFEIELAELDGKTAKMYRGGKICLTIHFKPLWAKNAPHFGIAHAMCLGLAPWLAAEVPVMVERGVLAEYAK
jgi:ufm1-conjugating enzyme 1